MYRPADIIIPTCRAPHEIMPMVREVRASAADGPRVMATCLRASAAVNRNAGLDWADTELVIMADDDIEGFPAGWNLALCAPLRIDPDIVMVSAALMAPGGKPGQMLGNPERQATGITEVARRELPTACIAFRNDGRTRFDARFIGSGWEDTDFASRLRCIYPAGKFVVVWDVRVVHRNEMKAQSVHFAANKARYSSVWGDHPYFRA